MNLLLLLSALLSALTGVSAGGRVPQATVAVAQVVTVAVAERSMVSDATGQPSFAPPKLAETARALPRLVWRLAVPVALFASRRRE